MTRHLFFPALLLISCALGGCSEKCESFNPSILEWMPFREGDELQIQDSLGAYTLTVGQSAVNHTIKIRKRSRCTCEDRFLLELRDTWLSVDVFFHDSHDAENSDVVINNDLLLFAEHLNKVTINGHVYSEVIVYQNQSASANTQFVELTIARSIGLVSIKSTTHTWYRVDNEVRIVDPSKLIFNDHSCV